MFVTDLKESNVKGLRVNGKRAIRARYPNADPEFGFQSELKANGYLPPKTPTMEYHDVELEYPKRDFQKFVFTNYFVGIGGPCEVYDPPAGMWCSKHVRENLGVCTGIEYN